MSETNVFTESVCLNNRQLWNVSWHVHHSAFSFPYITRVAVQSQGLFPFLSPPSWCLGHPTRGGNKPRKHSIRPKLCCGSENFRGPLNKKPERSKMKNPLQKQRLTQQALVGEGNTLPFPIATEIPQRVIKKKREWTAYRQTFGVAVFESTFSSVLHSRLRDVIYMYIWFSFYLYPWRCDVTRYIRTCIYTIYIRIVR